MDSMSTENGVLVHGRRIVRCAVVAGLVLGGAAAQGEVWIPRDLPYKVYDQAAVTDLGRGRVVMFARAATWEWDGSEWTRRRPAQEPPRRCSTSMAYDAKRGCTVLFGGLCAVPGGIVNDTWEYDGTAWRQLAPQTAPAPRYFASMAYDFARSCVVLVGGFGVGGVNYRDTWEWDGTTWSQKGSSPGGTSIGIADLTYDSTLQQVTLVIGNGSTSSTWRWDGANWSQVGTAVTLPELLSSALGYDEVRRRAVYFGSLTTGGEQTWEFDGTTWTQATPALMPPFAGDADFVWDPVRQHLVLLGAGDYKGAELPWQWDGTNWMQIQTRTDAEPGLSALTYDTARQRAVLVLGQGAGIPGCSTTWEWDGTSWKDMTVAGPCHGGPAIAYDAARQRTVLFGGSNPPGTPTNLTIEWDGTRWTTRSPATRPLPRQYHALAYDSARQRVVLFGGSRNSQFLDDTWEWDGTTWTQRVIPGPAPRFWHGLAYDAARGKTVLFGGYRTNLGFNNETWEWDGTTWTQRSPATSPPPMELMALAYHAGRQRVMLYGGGDATTIFTDAWEWDGIANTWTKLAFASQPPTGSYLTYDTARQEMLLLGGVGLDFRSANTWTLSPTVAAAAAPYGTGCGSIVPLLDGFGRPFVGNGSFALDVYQGMANAPAAILVAAAAANLPWGSCTVLIDPGTAIALPRSTNALGFASLRLPIPAQTVLIGATAASQAAVVDASAPLGLGLTQGLGLVLGK